MEQQLHAHEERLFDLLESKDFEQLSTAERDFAASYLPEDEYRLRRRAITEAAAAFPGNRPARPLALPPRKALTVPLWQAVAAVAATAAIFLTLWPRQQTPNDGDPDAGPQISRTDTVIQTKYMVDTVVRYVRIRDSRSREKNIVSDGLSAAAPQNVDTPAPVHRPKPVQARPRASMKQDEASGLLFGVYQSTKN